MHYDLVKNYSMKCRLYPNKEQAAAIDNAILAVKVYHNCVLYDMFVNHICVKEKEYLDKTTKEKKILHYPDVQNACKKDNKNRLLNEHPIINAAPPRAISGSNGLLADLKKEFGKKPIEFLKPNYYNNNHQRKSYTYQHIFNKTEKTIIKTENKNVLFVKLDRIGKVKMRGWNQKLRFGDSMLDFCEWAYNKSEAKDNYVTITVSKDSVGNYYIVWKIPECYKPFNEKPDSSVGVDVGVKDLAVTSDGTKFENKKFKREEKSHQKHLNRQLSRRWGPSNEKFRAASKARKAEITRCKNAGIEPPQPIVESNGYKIAKMRNAILNQKIANKRANWNHEVSKAIVESNDTIALENLNVSGMEKNKHIAFSISDAAIYMLMQDIKYKAEWHGRHVLVIGRWVPSSKRCSSCGWMYNNEEYKELKKWGLGIRHWVCPVCKTSHDRDINAAKNILYYAINREDN